MRVYTYSEARQKLAAVLDRAGVEGGVRIRRRDGKAFVVLPERPASSPLDVKGISTSLSRKEIVDFVRAGRKRIPEVRPLPSWPGKPKRRATS